jgi:hypothetical protein
MKEWFWNAAWKLYGVATSTYGVWRLLYVQLLHGTRYSTSIHDSAQTIIINRKKTTFNDFDTWWCESRRFETQCRIRMLPLTEALVPHSWKKLLVLGRKNQQHRRWTMDDTERLHKSNRPCCSLLSWEWFSVHRIYCMRTFIWCGFSNRSHRAFTNIWPYRTAPHRVPMEQPIYPDNAHTPCVRQCVAIATVNQWLLFALLGWCLVTHRILYKFRNMIDGGTPISIRTIGCRDMYSTHPEQMTALLRKCSKILLFLVMMMVMFGGLHWVYLPTTVRSRALRAYIVDTEAVVTKKRMIRMGLRVVYFTTTLRKGQIVHEFDCSRIISSSELLQNCIVRHACRRRVVELRHMVWYRQSKKPVRKPCTNFVSSKTVMSSLPSQDEKG